MTRQELIERIKGGDDKARGDAWQSAGPVGAGAVKPLAELATNAEPEVARAARRALWNIVRHAGRPTGGAETGAVAKELVPLLAAGSPDVRREFVWMLSEIGGSDAVPAISALLKEKELREDARAALQRIPGELSLRALKVALKSGPEDHKPAVAVSLRARGEAVSGHPDGKLRPLKATAVKQAATGAQ
jgi:HEAT repeat protein